MFSPDERIEFGYCLTALRKYRTSCLEKLKKLNRTEDQLAKLSEAINTNSNYFDFLFFNGPSSFGITLEDQIKFPFNPHPFSRNELYQLESALKAVARDWGEVGSPERNATYYVILQYALKYLSKGSSILVPGSGLCRLACELSISGFTVDANENSFIMLITSFAILTAKRTFQIFPFLHQLDGVDKFEDTLLEVVVPYQEQALYLKIDHDGSRDWNNTTPNDLLLSEELQLSAGDFFGVYKDVSSKYDSVITSFFIDTLDNIKTGIQLIYQTLKPGGIWINFGPIHLHNSDDDFFCPFSFEDLVQYSIEAGFELIEEQKYETSYSLNPKNHITTKYRCTLNVFRK